MAGYTPLESASLAVFAAFFAALLVGCARAIGVGRVDVHSCDRILLATFCMMLFVAWFFEPYVVALCGWEGLETASCQRDVIGQLWFFYAKTFDPVFLNLPTWLRLVCSLDTFVFGFFYAASIYALRTNRVTQRWYVLLALPMCGALIYSTIVYFGYELLAEAHRCSLLWVFVVNLPWTLCPLLLLLRLGQAMPAELGLKTE
jgi:hypothetical protein